MTSCAEFQNETQTEIAHAYYSTSLLKIFANKTHVFRITPCFLGLLLVCVLIEFSLTFKVLLSPHAWDYHSDLYIGLVRNRVVSYLFS